MIWHSLVSAHTFQRVSIVLGWVHGCCQCVNVWEKHFEMEARRTMRFRFTKLPDAFKLCHHLFVSNTVFQKMSSLTVFFSVQLWDCKQIQALGWKCYSWEHQYNHVLPCDRSPLFAFGKCISLPSVYEHITLNRQDHLFTWSSWKSPSPSHGCCSDTVGQMVQKGWGGRFCWCFISS